MIRGYVGVAFVLLLVLASFVWLGAANPPVAGAPTAIEVARNGAFGLEKAGWHI